MLLDLEDTQDTDTDTDTSSEPPLTPSLDEVRIDKATRVSSKHLQEVTFTRAYMAAWQKRKATDGDVQDHWDTIRKPENSPKAARSVQDVARVSKLRREASHPIRLAQSTNRLLNMRHTQELSKKRAKADAAARLKKTITSYALARKPYAPTNRINASTGFCRRCHRHHPPILRSGRHPGTRLSYQVNCCPRTRPQNVTVFAYGAAGSGVGSRIGGHLRWGGKWMRQELLRLGIVVALTDEYCTSKTCVHCFQRLQLQRSRRLIGTDIKTRRVHGSVVCVNPLCPAVKAGYATRPRDSNAAVRILLSAASVMLTDAQWPLAPYSRYIRPLGVPTINTGEHNPDQMDHVLEQMGPPGPSAIMDTAGTAEN